MYVKPDKNLRRLLNRHMNWLLGRRAWHRYRWTALNTENVGRAADWRSFPTGMCAALTFVYHNGEHLYFIVEGLYGELRVTAWQVNPQWTVMGPLFGEEHSGNPPIVLRNPTEAGEYLDPFSSRKFLL